MLIAVNKIKLKIRKPIVKMSKFAMKMINYAPHLLLV